MKKVCPERSRLMPGTSISGCRNVQILPIRSKRGAGAVRILGGGLQIGSMKCKCQLYVTNCQVSCSSRIVVN